MGVYLRGESWYNPTKPHQNGSKQGLKGIKIGQKGGIPKGQ